MNLPTHIKVIVFDAYGTLFNIGAIEKGLELHFGEKSDGHEQHLEAKTIGIHVASYPYGKI